MDTVRFESAIVFRGGGRRWFTLAAACKAAARKKIRTRCECDRGDEVTPPDTCAYHDDSRPWGRKVLRRLAAKYKAEAVANELKGVTP